MGKTSRAEKLRISGGHAGGHAHRRRHRLAVACRRRDPPPAGANFHQSHVLRGGAAGVFLHRAIAGMRSVRRAGRIMGVTVLTFVVTGILAAVLMFLLMKAFPPVLTPWQSPPTEAVGDYAAPGQSSKFLHRRGFRGPAESPGHAASSSFPGCWASPPISPAAPTARWPVA